VLWDVVSTPEALFYDFWTFKKKHLSKSFDQIYLRKTEFMRGLVALQSIYTLKRELELTITNQISLLQSSYSNLFHKNLYAPGT